MQRAKDYLLLSVLSYCNFSEEDYNKNLEQIYRENDSLKLDSDGFNFSNSKTRYLFYDFFKDILQNWEIFYVDNKRASNSDKDSTGFYSVVFKNIKHDKYVISYRGSEKYPLEDAYKDFIENDLKIGLGIKPLQFYNGLDVFNRIYDEFKIPQEKISITGHSLGGGIAQFVSIMVDKERGFIPYTCTWNAVGINRDGIINLLDFFNYDKILKKLDLDDIEKQYFIEFKNEYLSFFLKELKKGKVIKDNNTLLIRSNTEISPQIDEGFVKSFIKNTKFENLLGKLSMDSKNKLLDNNKVFNALFKIDNLTEELYEADYFIRRVKTNKVYEENIVNFCHSEDLTVSLFPHIGAVYQVDKSFIRKEVKKKTIFSNFLFFTKSVQDYHHQDIFLPFIEVEGERVGMFSKNLCVGYLGSIIRKILTLEHCVENELLADYYSLILIDNQNFMRVKTAVLNAIKKCGDNILYKNQAYNQLKDMNQEMFTKVWENIKIKLPSPYRIQDIYDLILF
ncbi:MAG: hypothetical protein ACRC5W_08670 [Cetobacterium sp.]|uniref:hypothetical protein n=1 Tax=Cetobacterium sp. TaxID=2071632 RepID=UPI003F3CD673